MKKQRKLLTDEEKEKICNDRNSKCRIDKLMEGTNQCPLMCVIGNCYGFCYKNINKIIEEIKELHNEEVEI